ncbi:MAG: hypothetical protein JXQ73_02490 [Phycisphaerae bacterium]|nr:hypothetical protein [Phycisphaerae bacterium]
MGRRAREGGAVGGEAIATELRAVDRCRRPAVGKRLARLEPAERLTYLRVVNGKAAAGAAIAVYCRNCCGGGDPGECDAVACELWAYRIGTTGR